MSTRVYVLVKSELSSAQRGVQAAHALAELVFEYGKNKKIKKWVKEDRTLVFLQEKKDKANRIAFDALSNDIKLIGFDLHSKDQYMNNIYKDTTNYNNSDHHYIDPRYWIHQIGVLMMMYPSIKFKIYQTANFKLPNNWKLPNVSVDTFDNL